ncbi:MAG: thioredoxin family protein [Burkholderiaceae bacterium]|nr:thioredoxin family protein [Burkholderiaceae bacterium]
MVVQAQARRVDSVQVELVARQTAAVAGQDFEAGLLIRHDPHWHTYWRNPGDSGLPTRLEWQLPAGWKAGEILWPAPARVLIGPLANYGYEGDVVLPVTVSVPSDARTGPVELAVTAQWLMCKDVCIPGEARLTLTLPVQRADRGELAPSAHRALFDQSRARRPAGVLEARAALTGGRISFDFDQPTVSRAEFFPYREGIVAPAAVQVLQRLGTSADGRYRLETDLPEGVPAGQTSAALDGKQVLGVLVLDGKVVELVAQAQAGASPGPAETISQAVGVQLLAAAGADRAASGQPSGRLLGATDDAPGRDAVARIGDAPIAGLAAGVTSLWLAALLGAVGGLILNLMPCVFPVIGLKVLGFAGHGAQGPAGAARARMGALAFAAGVLATFLGLAALLLVLRAAGQSVGWGFQLQSPVFVAGMALLFVVIALNFAGQFEFGLSLTRLGQHDAALAARASQVGGGQLLRSFGSGVLAVLVATPCTAPFMGSALGYTLGQPAAAVLAVFAAIALGMALPYLVLGFVPRLLAWLPRPGRWMESLRQFLAFPMLATAAWLCWVLGQQAGIDAVLALAMGSVFVALAGWLYGRFVQSSSSRLRGPALILAVATFAGGAWLALSQAASGDALQGAAGPNLPARGAPGASLASRSPASAWQPWSEQRIADALAAGHPVFVDFTAAWCVSCQANKRLALERASVRGAFEQAGVVLLRADWTQRDPLITAALAKHGRNGVPLYLLYAPGRDRPVVLPELLTPGIVLSALADSRRAL